MQRLQSGMALVFWLLCQASFADELLMKNGSRLIGRVVSAEQGKVVFSTPFAGELSINSENIYSMVTEEKVTLLMADGTVYRDQRVKHLDDKMLITTPENESFMFEAIEISLINPEPWKLGEGYKWFGEASLAAEVERGNSDSDEFDFIAESIWRSLTDRYTLRSEVEIDKTDGDKTKDNRKIRGKYDRFRQANADDYYGWQLFFEKDEFADLDLRSLTGPYVGRQFYDGNILDLAGEVGVVYVDEQFDVAEDNDFWGANWEVRLTSDWFSEFSEFYVLQVGILNFDDIEGVLVDTTIGLGFEFFDGFEVATEVVIEYDGGAVDEVDDTDTTTRIRLGYKW